MLNAYLQHLFPVFDGLPHSLKTVLKGHLWDFGGDWGVYCTVRRRKGTRSTQLAGCLALGCQDHPPGASLSWRFMCNTYVVAPLTAEPR